MDEERIRAYQDLPKAESCRRIEFEHAEVVTLESFPPQYVLTVSGTKPYLNMEVDLYPLVYVRQPEHWGIEVVGCLRGLGLPTQAPYTVSIPLAGVTGIEGIEVIGATRSERIEVPPRAPQRDCSGWSAVHDREPPGAVLRVRGSCQFPAAGYSVELRRHEPQGINPRELLLEQVVQQPSGPTARVITVVEVEYREESDAKYDTVMILPDGVSVPVEEVW